MLYINVLAPKKSIIVKACVRRSLDKRRYGDKMWCEARTLKYVVRS